MVQKPSRTKRRISLLTLATLLSTKVVLATSNSDFDEILHPITVVYDLVKYASTVISGLVLLFAGITYIASGSDPGKREKAKNMIMYVIIGLIVIWAAPFIADLILGN